MTASMKRERALPLSILVAGIGVGPLLMQLLGGAQAHFDPRGKDGRTVLIGTAFTGAATLPVGGALFALSTLPALRRPANFRALLALQAGAVAAVIGLGGHRARRVRHGLPGGPAARPHTGRDDRARRAGDRQRLLHGARGTRPQDVPADATHDRPRRGGRHRLAARGTPALAGDDLLPSSSRRRRRSWALASAP